MDLTPVLLCVAAEISQNLYQEGNSIGTIDSKLDWSHSFTNRLSLLMLSSLSSGTYTSPSAVIMNHEGGNISAHTGHLVGMPFWTCNYPLQQP